MTATAILKEIKALPPREKAKLMKKIENERELSDAAEDVRLFDEAVRATVGEKPMELRTFFKQSKIKV